MDRELVIQVSLMNERDAAEYLGISTRSMLRLRKEGKIAFVRVGKGLIRYTRNQLDDYINGATVRLGP